MRTFLLSFLLLGSLAGGLLLAVKWTTLARKAQADVVERASVLPPLFKLEHGWQTIEKTENPHMAIVVLPSGERVLVTFHSYNARVSLDTLLLPPLPAPTVEK